MTVAVTTEKVKAEISWNLPPVHQPVTYTAGQPLDITIDIKNPTDAALSYVLTLGLYDPVTGHIMVANNEELAWALKIDLEAKTFTLSKTEYSVVDLGAGDTLSIKGSPTFPLSNVLIGLHIYEYDKTEKKPITPAIASLFSALREPVVPWPNIIPLISTVITIGMLGFMMKQLEKLAPPK